MEKSIVGKVRCGEIAFTDLEYEDATRSDVIEAALDYNIDNFQYVSERNKELAAENYFSKIFDESRCESKSKYENIYKMMYAQMQRMENVIKVCNDESFEDNEYVAKMGLNLIANLCSFMQNDVRDFGLNENGEIDKDVRLFGESVYIFATCEAENLFIKIRDEKQREKMKESLEFCAKFDCDLNNASIIEK